MADLSRRGASHATARAKAGAAPGTGTAYSRVSPLPVLLHGDDEGVLAASF